MGCFAFLRIASKLCFPVCLYFCTENYANTTLKHNVTLLKMLKKGMQIRNRLEQLKTASWK